MITVSTLLLGLLSLSTASSLSTKDGGHHPNSVYAQISAHKKKDLRIFYQNGVSQVFPGYWSRAIVRLLCWPEPHMLAGYFYQYCKILTVSQSEC